MRNAKCGMRNEGQPGNSAFRIPHSALERPLILVDDVFTTGATLAEAARALDQAGARTVSAVTFGRAVVPDFTYGRAMAVRVGINGVGGIGRNVLPAAGLTKQQAVDTV